MGSEATLEEMVDCPFCSESIKAKAKKCKHCGETLDVALRAAEEAKRANQSSGGGGGGAASSTVVIQDSNNRLRSFPHIWHLLATCLFMGFWFPIWVLHYIFRDRRYYF